jgi:alkanesulfonate monooxygenase SsuD/methylene tetrahydromethanopterin reductase-like flavin-dependent oxidoreductase (luciferase family)
LIPTENWTMRPVPDVPDLVRFAVEAERAGIDGVMVSEHIVLGPATDEGLARLVGAAPVSWSTRAA